jgi:ribonuclease HII
MTARFDPSLLPPAPDLSFELPLWESGLARVGGIDEAGRGAWAGPVSAGVVVLPPGIDFPNRLRGVRDSKQMTPAQREHWAAEIRSAALDWGVGLASAAEIDALGILPATRLAVRRALEGLALPPQYLLVDFLRLPEIGLPQLPLVKGDARALSIACASVLAKTARDALMRELDALHPAYGFARHKGYGTRLHQQAILHYGLCESHRKSFRIMGREGKGKQGKM